MLEGNLTDQTEAQAHAPGMFGVAGQAVEGLENALALVVRHAGPAVVHPQADVTGAMRELHPDVRATIAASVLQQVARSAAQQAIVA